MEEPRAVGSLKIQKQRQSAASEKERAAASAAFHGD
jgi:hypothetical protein